jgi:hypothetical protein
VPIRKQALSQMLHLVQTNHHYQDSLNQVEVEVLEQVVVVQVEVVQVVKHHRLLHYYY